MHYEFVAHRVRLCTFLLEAEDGADPIPVPYRYNLSPVPPGKCNVFKPTPLPEGSAARIVF